MVAYFVRFPIEEARIILSENDIYYEEWYNDNGEVELRIDMENLDEDEFNVIINNFGSECKMYSYLIVWY